MNYLADLDVFTGEPLNFNKNIHRAIVPEGFYA